MTDSDAEMEELVMPSRSPSWQRNTRSRQSTPGRASQPPSSESSSSSPAPRRRRAQFPLPPWISYFDTDEKNTFPFRGPFANRIRERRAIMTDMLLFDILLSRGGIRQPDLLFPPVDVEGLKRLLDAIQNSTYDSLKKECLVYSLIKWHFDDDKSNRFKNEREIVLPQFVALADAYWCLDAGEDIERAIYLLSDSRINTDYASKILEAIATAQEVDNTSLIIRYIRTAKPLLTEPNDLDLYIVALATTSLFEAWTFQRSFGEKHECRERLIRKILGWSVTPQPRPEPLTKLLSLPMSPYEQSLLHSYALHPPSTLSSASVAAIQNLICVRLIQAGKYAEAIKVDRELPSNRERKEIVDELMGVLSPTERALLDAPRQPRRGVNGTTVTPASSMSDTTMSSSWEEIPLPAPKVNGATTTAKVAKAPRFSMGASSSAALPIVPATSSSGLGASVNGPRLLSNGLTSSVNGLSSSIAGFASSINGTRPVSGTSAPPLIPTGPRKSLPNQSTNFTITPRRSINNATLSLFSSPLTPLSSSVLGASTSSTALRASTSRPPPSSFASSGRASNAFYRPPPPPQQIQRRSFAEVEEDIDMDKSKDHEESQSQDDDRPAFIESVFKPTSPPTSEIEAEQVTPSTPAPPGGLFTPRTEDWEPLLPPTKKSRPSDTVPQTRQSIPGAFGDDGDEDDSVAEDDEIAPLPEPEPVKKRQTRARTKAVAAPASETGSEDGDSGPRRRSSRLSTAPAKKATTTSGGKTITKKAKATGGRKSIKK